MTSDLSSVTGDAVSARATAPNTGRPGSAVCTVQVMAVSSKAAVASSGLGSAGWLIAVSLFEGILRLAQGGAIHAGLLDSEARPHSAFERSAIDGPPHVSRLTAPGR